METFRSPRPAACDGMPGPEPGTRGHRGERYAQLELETRLKDLRDRAKPPQLVVTSRQADESLWSEVLNVGGYDVMAQPLDSNEVERVVASAHRHFDYRPLTAGA